MAENVNSGRHTTACAGMGLYCFFMAVFRNAVGAESTFFDAAAAVWLLIAASVRRWSLCLCLCACAPVRLCACVSTSHPSRRCVSSQINGYAVYQLVSHSKNYVRTVPHRTHEQRMLMAAAATTVAAAIIVPVLQGCMMSVVTVTYLQLRFKHTAGLLSLACAMHLLSMVISPSYSSVLLSHQSLPTFLALYVSGSHAYRQEAHLRKQFMMVRGPQLQLHWYWCFFLCVGAGALVPGVPCSSQPQRQQQAGVPHGVQLLGHRPHQENWPRRQRGSVFGHTAWIESCHQAAS